MYPTTQPRPDAGGSISDHLGPLARPGWRSGLLAGLLALGIGGCGDKESGDSGAGGGDEGADGDDGGDEGTDGEDGTEGTDGGEEGGDEGSDDPSPVVLTAEYSCSVSGSADDTIIFLFTVDDPQGADTIDQFSGVIACLDPGGTDIFASNPIAPVCDTAGNCTGSMPTTAYPMDCTSAPDHSCSVTVSDDTGNTGSGDFTWVSR